MMVSASLRFIRHQPTKPYFHSAQLTGGAPRFFFEGEEHEVLIQNMREVVDSLSLDRHGFQLVDHTTSLCDLYDDQAVRDIYHPEIEAMLRKTLGAKRVVVFDSTRRSDSADGPRTQMGPASLQSASTSTTPSPMDRIACAMSSGRRRPNALRTRAHESAR